MMARESAPMRVLLHGVLLPLLRSLLLPLLLLPLMPAGPAAAQVVPNQRYETFRTEHFRITFEPRLEALARHAGAAAERAHAALSVLVADPPSSTIELLVTDNVDYTNGFARVFPSNRVTIYARPPVDMLELQYTRDWIELVVTHELAHIYHLDVTGGLGKLVRSIFGRVPAAWPVFPAVATPGWSIEGLATVVESSVTGFGRTHGTYEEMIVRTAVLEGGFNDIDMLSSSSPLWPGGSRIYVYGSLFLDYLERRFGADAIARVVSSISGAWIPPFLWFDRIGSNALGISFHDAYRDWRKELAARYASLADEMRSRGLTPSTALTKYGYNAFYPRFSPDGQSVAYISTDGRTPAHLRVIDAQTGAVRWNDRRNFVFSQAVWSTADTLIVSDIGYTDPFHVHRDLRIVTRDDEEELTEGARLEQPDAKGNAIVAIRNIDGTNQLVLLDERAQLKRALSAVDPLVHWSAPRLSPRGDRIAVARWRTGGRTDIVVMDTTGNVLTELAAAPGINAAPAWTPDERWIVFQSDRTGIPNLFATEVGTPARMLQVSNVLTGAFMPDVSPDGSAIVFAMAHGDGFHIERMQLDTTQWRTPAAVEVASVHRNAYEDVATASAIADSMNAAVARADTTAGPNRGYSAWSLARPHFWVPVIETGASSDRYFGVWTSGEDLIGRHYWSVSAAADPSSGRTKGDLDYIYNGLPSLGRFQPTLTMGASRFWDVIQEQDSAGGQYIEEREDAARIGIGFDRPSWRTSAGFNISAELVRRSRHLYNAPTLRLRDPVDDLYGARASTYFANYSQPAFAISRQDGVLLQVFGLERRERDPQTITVDNRTFVLDGGYSEIATRNTAYRSLPGPGFARHVIAFRAAAIRRSGPGAGLVNLGGASAAGFSIPGLVDGVGTSSQLLALRGIEEGERRGNIGWAASAEYRVPVALVSTSLHPLPLYFDRIAAAAFADMGHAWCDDDAAQRFVESACRFTSARATPVTTAGFEVTAFFSGFSALIPVRAGIAFPIAGLSSRTPGLHVLIGMPF
jgi:dipeptidyl aminopeptidase/acylaminoacyl peptidase